MSSLKQRLEAAHRRICGNEKARREIEAAVEKAREKGIESPRDREASQNGQRGTELGRLALMTHDHPREVGTTLNVDKAAFLESVPGCREPKPD
jgi:hypothetical protein